MLRWCGGDIFRSLRVHRLRFKENIYIFLILILRNRSEMWWPGKITRQSRWMRWKARRSSFRLAFRYWCSTVPCFGWPAVPVVWAPRRLTEILRCSPTSPRCRCTLPVDPYSCRSRRVRWPAHRTAPVDWAWYSGTLPSHMEPDDPCTSCKSTIL